MHIEDLEPLLERVEKPARYVGGELGSIIKSKDTPVSMAFCFPDTYEIGMSHLGLKILYDIVNHMDICRCERVFAPWTDFEEELKKAGLPLYSLETFSPLSEFDIIGFTLQYELSFTTILQMMDLGNVPVLANERKDLDNLVIAGGPCACNPEPLCDFVDVFFIGEAEESLPEFIELYKLAKEQKLSKNEFLLKAARIEGILSLLIFSISSTSMALLSNVASTTISAISTSSTVLLTELIIKSPSFVLGLCIPGVSIKIICSSFSVKTPIILLRVVWGLGETIATFSPKI